MMAYWDHMDVWDWGWMAATMAFWVIVLAFAYRGVVALRRDADWPSEHPSHRRRLHRP
jgi:flagellar biosynthesis/type III secretory pathway M-ring protein FliF/YscJ